MKSLKFCYNDSTGKSNPITTILCLTITLTLVGAMIFIPHSYAATSSDNSASSSSLKKVTVLDSQSFNYKCIDGKTVKAKIINLDASKSGSSYKGTWKISGANGGVKSGSITSGKQGTADKEGVTPISFSGPIKSDTLCATGAAASSSSQTMQISTYCFADDDVRTTFKSGTTSSEGLAHVECK